MRKGMAFLLVVPACCLGATIRVPADHGTMQGAIDAAADGDTVLVAPGEYVIAQPIDFNRLHDPGDPGSPPLKSLTVRSEAGPGQTVIRMSETPDDPARACVAIFEKGEATTCRLEGFTLTAGKGVNHEGGGVRVMMHSAATLERCAISANEGPGPAVAAIVSSIVLRDCTIVDNAGGGVVIGDAELTPPEITRCTIARNAGYGILLGDSSLTIVTACHIAENEEGGIRCGDCSPTITGCRIVGNGGPGASLKDSGPSLTHCTIAGNREAGVRCQESSARLFTCTVADNDQGGIVAADEDSDALLEGSIVWGNAVAAIVLAAGSTAQATYSCVEGDAVMPGAGNLNLDPLFCRRGRWDDNATPGDIADDRWIDGDYRLSPNSPCIGAGEGEATMGAEPDPCSPVDFRRGDANADGGVNIADAVRLLGYLFAGEAAPPCSKAADANDDGGLNIADAIAILTHLFAASGSLPPPFETCGGDPTADGLGCTAFDPCSASP